MRGTGKVSVQTLGATLFPQTKSQREIVFRAGNRLMNE